MLYWTHPQIHFTSLSRSHFDCKTLSFSFSLKFTGVSTKTPPTPFSAPLFCLFTVKSTLAIRSRQIYAKLCIKRRKKFMQASCKGHLQWRYMVVVGVSGRDALHWPTCCTPCILSPNQIFHFKCYLFYCCLADSKGQPRPA